MLMTIVMNYVVSKLWNSLHSKLYLNDFDNYYYIFDNVFYEETVHAWFSVPDQMHSFEYQTIVFNSRPGRSVQPQIPISANCPSSLAYYTRDQQTPYKWASKLCTNGPGFTLYHCKAASLVRPAGTL